eukprot:SAG11_NODE_1846_length_4172_cov_3.188313_1_plen_113_part_00
MHALFEGALFVSFRIFCEQSLPSSQSDSGLIFNGQVQVQSAQEVAWQEAEAQVARHAAGMGEPAPPPDVRRRTPTGANCCDALLFRFVAPGGGVAVCRSCRHAQFFAVICSV